MSIATLPLDRARRLVRHVEEDVGDLRQRRFDGGRDVVADLKGHAVEGRRHRLRRVDRPQDDDLALLPIKGQRRHGHGALPDLAHQTRVR